MIALAGLSFAGCKKDQPAIKYSPVWPVAGEWHVHVANADGSSAAASFVTLNTFNTSDNANNQIWVKVGTASTNYGLLGKSNCDVSAKSFSVTGSTNTLFTNSKFTILEGKVMMGATTLKSKVVGDSIYVKYTTEKDGKTYILSGHRRTGFNEDAY